MNMQLDNVFGELCKECYDHKFGNLKYFESDITVDDIFYMKNDKIVIAKLTISEDCSDIRCVVGEVKPSFGLYKLINDINSEADFVKCVIENECLTIKYYVMTSYENPECAYLLRDALDDIANILQKLDFNKVFNSSLLK